MQFLAGKKTYLMAGLMAAVVFAEQSGLVSHQHALALYSLLGAVDKAITELQTTSR